MSIVIYVGGHRPPDVSKRVYIPVMKDFAVARAWLDYFIGNNPIDRVGNRITLRTDFDITLETNELTTILETQPAPLDEPTRRLIARFKHGSWDEDHTETIEQEAKAAQPAKQPRPEKPAGLTTITELCKQHNVIPLKARAALRGSGMTKPDFGWSFYPHEIETVKKIIGVK